MLCHRLQNKLDHIGLRLISLQELLGAGLEKLCVIDNVFYLNETEDLPSSSVNQSEIVGVAGKSFFFVSSSLLETSI